MIVNWQEKIKIWEGLEDFREILLKLFAYDVNKINQKTLDLLFGNEILKLKEAKKNLLIKEIQKQLKEEGLDEDLKKSLQQQLSELEILDDELVISRRINNFDYEIVLKSKSTQKIFSGFVKIIDRFNSKHRGLLSWQQDKRNPILFLAELKNNQVSFHINLGKADGLIILEELAQGYRWTQCNSSEYPDLINAEHGSIFYDKNTGNISLEDGNIAAAMALSKAQTANDQGLTVFENNIELMNIFKKDLEELDFSF